MKLPTVLVESDASGLYRADRGTVFKRDEYEEIARRANLFDEVLSTLNDILGPSCPSNWAIRLEDLLAKLKGEPREPALLKRMRDYGPSVSTDEKELLAYIDGLKAKAKK